MHFLWYSSDQIFFFFWGGGGRKGAQDIPVGMKQAGSDLINKTQLTTENMSICSTKII